MADGLVSLPPDAPYSAVLGAFREEFASRFSGETPPQRAMVEVFRRVLPPLKLPDGCARTCVPTVFRHWPCWESEERKRASVPVDPDDQLLELAILFGEKLCRGVPLLTELLSGISEADYLYVAENAVGQLCSFAFVSRQPGQVAYVEYLCNSCGAARGAAKALFDHICVCERREWGAAVVRLTPLNDAVERLYLDTYKMERLPGPGGMLEKVLDAAAGGRRSRSRRSRSRRSRSRRRRRR